MYFFLLFGTHVENRVGPFQLLLVLFGASLAGDLATYVHDPSDDRVSIGASGGIAGIMLFFAFLFPKRPILWWEIPVPAVIFMLIWLAFEWIYGSIQVKGWDDGVGYYAHLGGGLFGWSYWFLARKRLGLAWENKKGVLDA
jgi:membrane associated rhomboid family serine protease